MKQRAFTLVEMLFVLLIIGIVTALTLPAFNNLGKAQALSSAGNAILDQLASARQIAVSKNRVVEVRFYKRRENPALPANATTNPERFRSLRTMIYDENVLNPVVLTPMQELPERIVISEEKEFSTLFYPYTNTVPPRDYVAAGLKEDLSDTEVNVPYQFIRFKPTGGTDLGVSGTPDGDKWFMTIKSDNEISTASRPSNNYSTLMLDPVSGRVRTYRP